MDDIDEYANTPSPERSNFKNQGRRNSNDSAEIDELMKSQDIALNSILQKVAMDEQGLIDLSKIDLNKLSNEEVDFIKSKMDVNFLQNQLNPGDPGFIYDKEVEFNPEESNDWDKSGEYQAYMAEMEQNRQQFLKEQEANLYEISGSYGHMQTGEEGGRNQSVVEGDVEEGGVFGVEDEDDLMDIDDEDLDFLDDDDFDDGFDDDFIDDLDDM